MFMEVSCGYIDRVAFVAESSHHECPSSVSVDLMVGKGCFHSALFGPLLSAMYEN